MTYSETMMLNGDKAKAMGINLILVPDHSESYIHQIKCLLSAPYYSFHLNTLYVQLVLRLSKFSANYSLSL